ncbi:hypothetical protein J7E50_18080 [Pedobacter sp. ISL-68]|uniref:DUF6520 family protein n=1 Tax=unclassified Pedobacter TaxID=2628915 RepID=UPI001BE4E37F|nr:MULTISPECIES: DUF6520 family protein [unclassified Pedobacter]MBT2559833.1 hypothetical protein [Pedobacter sp. ISL-64]MBT2592138.1 hypothetical protein [Pedobacter sp. ISL-68]
MKKFIFPVAVILMGAGAAFATKAGTSKNVLIDAYRIDAVSGKCINAEQQCSTLGNETCTWTADSVTPLHEEPISSTMCGEELFKVN